LAGLRGVDRNLEGVANDGISDLARLPEHRAADDRADRLRPRWCLLFLFRREVYDVVVANDRRRPETRARCRPVQPSTTCSAAQHRLASAASTVLLLTAAAALRLDVAQSRGERRAQRESPE